MKLKFNSLLDAKIFAPILCVLFDRKKCILKMNMSFN